MKELTDIKFKGEDGILLKKVLSNKTILSKSSREEDEDYPTNNFKTLTKPRAKFGRLLAAPRLIGYSDEDEQNTGVSSSLTEMIVQCIKKRPDDWDYTVDVDGYYMFRNENAGFTIKGHVTGFQSLLNYDSIELTLGASPVKSPKRQRGGFPNIDGVKYFIHEYVYSHPISEALRSHVKTFAEIKKFMKNGNEYLQEIMNEKRVEETVNTLFVD